MKHTLSPSEYAKLSNEKKCFYKKECKFSKGKLIEWHEHVMIPLVEAIRVVEENKMALTALTQMKMNDDNIVDKAYKLALDRGLDTMNIVIQELKNIGK